jgi:hypothetical protein
MKHINTCKAIEKPHMSYNIGHIGVRTTWKSILVAAGNAVSTNSGPFLKFISGQSLS